MRMFPIVAAAALLLVASFTADAAEAHCTLHFNMAGGGAFSASGFTKTVLIARIFADCMMMRVMG